MNRISIFTATLGLVPPWRVTSARFTDHSNRLDIHVEYTHRQATGCPACGEAHCSSPAGEVREIWYQRDFFSYAVYLHARVPLIACSCCGGSFPLERPWCRPGSKFMPIPRLES